MGVRRKIVTLAASSAATFGVLAGTTAYAANPLQLQSSSTTTSNVGITGGGLGLFNFSYGTVNFPPLTLNGDNQTTSISYGPLYVIDATGTGQGWKLTVSASTVTEVAPPKGFAPNTHALTLPNGSLTLNAPNVSSYVVNSGDAGATTSKPPIALSSPTAIDTGSAVTVLDAPPYTGMGAYQLAFPSNNALTLTVPASTVTVDPVNYPGTSTATPFSTTITWTVSSGP